MPYNVLLLPLLGGYVFVAFWNVTRFYSRRESGQRLIFWSAIAGFLHLCVSYGIVEYLSSNLPCIGVWWNGFAGYPHLAKSIGAFGIGSTSWIILNLFFKKKKWAMRTVSKWGDYLEVLLQESISRSKLVSLNLKNGKVYIGLVLQTTHNPSYDRKYIRILPVLSGHREATTHDLVIDTHYETVYNKMLQNEDSPFLIQDFVLVLSGCEILSASYFDPSVFELFNNLRNQGNA